VITPLPVQAGGPPISAKKKTICGLLLRSRSECDAAGWGDGCVLGEGTGGFDGVDGGGNLGTGSCEEMAFCGLS
jgi:hypothetical protein